MALVDYGAILKVNGKFINKNSDSLFMKETNLNYKPKDENIGGFVIAGDKDFLLEFHKGSCYVYSNEQKINSVYWSPFAKEIIYNGDLPSVTVEHLDKNKYPDFDIETWTEYYEHTLVKNHNYYRKYLRYLKGMKRYNKKYYTSRWKATWNYKGDNYEVIFGMGIDNDEIIWNKIKNEYFGFTETEIKIIDKWFKEEE